MINAPIALALAAGMVGALNPCAFSLLPAYLGFFVTGDDRAAPLERRVARAVGSAVAVTVGFVIVFSVLGLVLDQIAGRVRQQLPWIGIAVGVLLVTAGLASIAGRSLSLRVPTVRAVHGRSFAAMIAYGAVYAVASLSCTIGPFLAVTSTAIDRSLIGGLATYLAYAVGMGVVIMIIAGAAALARPGAAVRLRRLSRYTGRLGGLLMVVGGAYAILYARWELRVYDGRLETDPVVDAGERIRIGFVRWIERLGAPRLTLIVLIVTVTVLVVGRSHQNSTYASKADDA